MNRLPTHLLIPLVLPTLLLLVAYHASRGIEPPSSPQKPYLSRFQFRSPHMGTLFQITLYATNQAAAESAAEAAFRRILTLDEIMSDYRADSELNLLCKRPPRTPVPLSRDLYDVLSRSLEFARLSDGAFDPTVGPYVRLWRFARKRHKLPVDSDVQAARDASGWNKLQLDSKTQTATLLAENMRLDLGGIAKGYASDAALRELEKHGVDRALVAASGDIAVSKAPPGKPGWRVEISGINKRLDRPLLLENAAVSTSGDTEQFIEIDGVRYSHIVSPRTGFGLTNRIQATIISRRATMTDALGTAVCVLGHEKGLRLANSLPGTAAMIITREGDSTREYRSRRWGQYISTPGSISR